MPAKNGTGSYQTTQTTRTPVRQYWHANGTFLAVLQNWPILEQGSRGFCFPWVLTGRCFGLVPGGLALSVMFGGALTILLHKYTGVSMRPAVSEINIF